MMNEERLAKFQTAQCTLILRCSFPRVLLCGGSCRRLKCIRELSFQYCHKKFSFFGEANSSLLEGPVRETKLEFEGFGNLGGVTAGRCWRRRGSVGGRSRCAAADDGSTRSGQSGVCLLSDLLRQTVATCVKMENV